MKKTEEKSSRSAEGLYKFFIYFVLILLAVTIIVPVAWVFMASIKQNSEFYGNPWALPAGFYWQNFVNAWNGAKMGEYMLNSVIVTALALLLLLVKLHDMDPANATVAKMAQYVQELNSRDIDVDVRVQERNVRVVGVEGLSNA